MSRVITLKSTNGNDRVFVISRSISQPKKYWNLQVMEKGKEKYQETGYSTMKEAKSGIWKFQASDTIYK
jgi:hypothetical protein